jgi:4-diphosphocytidyl-2-C-methyl-D-erythritol kinase
VPAPDFRLPPSAFGTRSVPDGPDNICYKAVQALQDETKVSKGARIEIVKRIPAGAGLGGGSSDAAIALKLLNAAWELGLDTQRLADVGAHVGSDVSYFFTGGSALCHGRGERVRAIPSAAVFHFVLVWPRIHVSTREVYENVTNQLTENCQSAKICMSALEHGNATSLANSLFNRLEQPAFRLHPPIQSLKEEVRQLSTYGAMMSGSGSTVFGLCGDREESEIARDRLQHWGKAFSVSSCVSGGVPRGQG